MYLTIVFLGAEPFLRSRQLCSYSRASRKTRRYELLQHMVPIVIDLLQGLITN
jgi:hypothetical protein